MYGGNILKIHNLMEDFVQTRVDAMYTNLKEANVSWLNCDCDNCRQDTVCYVLNRVQPKYVISSRGVLHMNSDTNYDQLKVDVDAIALEGIRIIGASRRHNHSTNNNQLDTSSIGKPCFSFPTFMGAVYDGITFEPLESAEVSLTLNTQNAEMIDDTWNNPCKTFKSTRGAYSFCVKPILTNSENENQQFNFTIQVNAKDYTPISYAFSVPVTSKIQYETGNFSMYSLKIQDLFLFMKGIENPME